MTGQVDRPLIVLLGPTASGKTDLALQLATALDGEIIGADSRQVYRYMDIGTAKPTPLQMSQIPHHLVNVIDPDDVLTLARFQDMVADAIADIETRGRVPFLVGGTGQYITAVTEGWMVPEVPPNSQLRAELEAFAATHGVESLYERLSQSDPIAAAKIHPNNVRRVIRALEVQAETGVRFSELRRRVPPPYRIMELGLMVERQMHYDWADRRVDAMMAAGFLEEVRTLLERGYSRHLPAMSGLGYRQLAEHLVDDLPLAQAIADTKTATHNFIRRQWSWFRGHDRGVLWHNVQQLDVSGLIDRLQVWLARHR